MNNYIYNCSKCEKCLRTCIIIKIPGYENLIETFDKNINYNKIIIVVT